MATAKFSKYKVKEACDRKLEDIQKHPKVETVETVGVHSTVCTQNNPDTSIENTSKIRNLLICLKSVYLRRLH